MGCVKSRELTIELRTEQYTGNIYGYGGEVDARAAFLRTTMSGVGDCERESYPGNAWDDERDE